MARDIHAAEPEIPPTQGSARIVYVSSSGGAGVTTVAATVAALRPHWESIDTGDATPCRIGDADLVVGVCRTTADATAQLPALVDLLTTTGHVGRGVLVAVRDGLGPCPPAARARLRTAEPNFRAVVELPYVLRWTYGGSHLPASESYQRAAGRLVATLDRVLAEPTVAVGD